MVLRPVVPTGFVNHPLSLIPKNYAAQKAKYRLNRLAQAKAEQSIIKNANVTQAYILISYPLVSIFWAAPLVRTKTEFIIRNVT
jgi:hypothetical protein